MHLEAIEFNCAYFVVFSHVLLLLILDSMPNGSLALYHSNLKRDISTLACVCDHEDELQLKPESLGRGPGMKIAIL